MAVQYIVDETGTPTAVIVPIDEWQEIMSRARAEGEPVRSDTEYLLLSDKMRRRLLEARSRKSGKSWEEVQDALGL